MVFLGFRLWQFQTENTRHLVPTDGTPVLCTKGQWYFLASDCGNSKPGQPLDGPSPACNLKHTQPRKPPLSIGSSKWKHMSCTGKDQWFFLASTCGNPKLDHPPDSAFPACTLKHKLPSTCSWCSTCHWDSGNIVNAGSWCDHRSRNYHRARGSGCCFHNC